MAAIKAVLSMIAALLMPRAFERSDGTLKESEKVPEDVVRCGPGMVSWHDNPFRGDPHHTWERMKWDQDHDFADYS